MANPRRSGSIGGRLSTASAKRVQQRMQLPSGISVESRTAAAAGHQPRQRMSLRMPCSRTAAGLPPPFPCIQTVRHDPPAHSDRRGQPAAVRLQGLLRLILRRGWCPAAAAVLDSTDMPLGSCIRCWTRFALAVDSRPPGVPLRLRFAISRAACPTPQSCHQGCVTIRRKAMIRTAREVRHAIVEKVTS